MDHSEGGSSPEILALLASIDEVPAAKIRRIRSAMLKPELKQPVISFELDREHARPLIAAAQKLPGWNSAEPALAKTEGRGGRTQYRIVLELPAGITRNGRERVLARLCERLDQARVMYTGVVHAPDPHNDQRNYHAHVILYDRPCRYLPELGMWDFELPKQTDKDGLYIGGRADKSDLFKTSGKGSYFDVGRGIFSEFRAKWVEDCNVEIARAGLPIRYHAGTFQDLGIDQEPSKHVGNDDAALGAVGIPRPKVVENNLRGWRGELQRLLKRHQQTKAERTAPIDEARAALAEAGATPTPALEARIAGYESSSAKLAAIEEQRDKFFLEWDIAKSSALKTRETCRNLLSGLGKQGRKQIPDETLIRERHDAAQRFLDGIDARIAPLAGQAVALGRQLESESKALAMEVEAIVAGLEQARLTHADTRDRPPQLTTSELEVGEEQLAMISRETLEEEFNRILERIKQDGLVIDIGLRGGKPAYNVDGLLSEEQSTLELPQFRSRAREWLAKRHGFQTVELDRIEAYARQNTGSFLNLVHSADSSASVPKAVRTLYNRYRDHHRLKRLVHDLASKQARIRVEALGQAEPASVPIPLEHLSAGDEPLQTRLGASERSGDGKPMANEPQPTPALLKSEIVSASHSKPPAATLGVSEVGEDVSNEEARAVPPPNSFVEAGRPMPASQRERGFSREVTREPSGPDHVPDSPAVSTVGGVAPTDTNMGNENEHHDAKRRRYLLARGRVFDHLHRSNTAAGKGGAPTAGPTAMRTLSSLDLGSYFDGGQVPLFQVRGVHVADELRADRAVQLPGDSPGATGTGTGTAAIAAHEKSTGIAERRESSSAVPAASAESEAARKTLGERCDGLNMEGGDSAPANPTEPWSGAVAVKPSLLPPASLALRGTDQHEPAGTTGTGRVASSGANRDRLLPKQQSLSELTNVVPGEVQNEIVSEIIKLGPDCVRIQGGVAELIPEPFSEHLRPCLQNASTCVSIANAISDARVALVHRQETEQAREAELMQGLLNKGKGR